jgi:hypothetical protein
MIKRIFSETELKGKYGTIEQESIVENIETILIYNGIFEKKK